MKRELTQKQKMFVREYLIDLNATQAAIRAGYSAKTAGWIGPQLLGKTHIADAIQQCMTKRADRLDIDADNVLQEIAKLAFSDVRNVFDEHGALIPVHKMEPKVSAAVSSIKFTTKTIPGAEAAEVEHVAEIKFWDKGASLERLGKHLKLFNEVGSKENPFCLDDLTEEQLLARIAMRKKELGFG